MRCRNENKRYERYEMKRIDKETSFMINVSKVKIMRVFKKYTKKKS